MLAHVITLAATVLTSFGWLAALIIYFVKRDESKFTAFHAMQALLFQLVLFVATLLAVPFVILTFGIGALLVPIIGIVLLAIYVVAAMRANEGEYYEMPFVGRWARNIVGV